VFKRRAVFFYRFKRLFDGGDSHSSFFIFFAAAFVTVFGAGFSAALLAAVLGTGFLCEIGVFFAAAALAAPFEAPDFVESLGFLGAGFFAAVLVVGFLAVVADLWFDVLAMIYSFFGTKSASC
jgi:hypothetical protein